MNKKEFSAESLFDFSFISELEFSPDGKEYLYVRNSLNRKDNAYVKEIFLGRKNRNCLLYTSPSPRERTRSRMPASA